MLDFFYIFGEGKMTMETDAVKQINRENLKKNKIQVSNTKKPLFFYVNLAKVGTLSGLDPRIFFFFLFDHKMIILS